MTLRLRLISARTRLALSSAYAGLVRTGSVAHAMMTIGPAMIMIEAEWPALTSRAPKLDGSSPVVIYVYVEDVDKMVERAVAGGAKVLFPVANQFWGDRIGG